MNKTNTDIDIGTSNTARVPNIKHNSPEVKDVCYFAERIRHMLDVKINHLRVAMQKSDNLSNSDMFMIRIQALEWGQGKIQDLILLPFKCVIVYDNIGPYVLYCCILF